MSGPSLLPDERRLAAVWFADLVGFSRLAAEDEAAALRLLRLFHASVREEIARRRGHLVKFIGDAAFAEFTSVEVAVRTALVLQRRFATDSARAGLPARLRVGVHIGDVVTTTDGDLYGDGVNIAARLQVEAEPGRVLVSEDVWRQLRQRKEYHFHALGERELKGITPRMAVFDVEAGTDELEERGLGAWAEKDSRSVRAPAFPSPEELARTAATPSEVPPPFLGRAKELQLIRSLVARVEAGHGGTLILRGETGIGKSRLLRVARDEAARRGWRHTIGRAYPVVSGVPYALFTDAFLPLLQTLPQESLSQLASGLEGELTHLFPGIAEREVSAPATGLDPGEHKSRLLFGVSRFVSRLVDAGPPLLLTFDDLQWADASSLELLHFLSRHIVGHRVALLAAYNEPLRDQTFAGRTLPEWAAGAELMQVHEVAPLSPEETTSLVETLLGTEQAARSEIAELLYRRTRGNPFFVEEILKAMVPGEGSIWSPTSWPGRKVEAAGLPDTVREAVLRRLEALSGRAREVADLLAVVGINVTHDALRAVSEMSERDLVDAVDELRHFRVVEERLEGGEILYDFTHPVVRETLYGELGLARTELLHSRVAEALEGLYGARASDHAGQLAYQFARTHSPRLAEKAVQYLCAAGREALAKYSNREAADFLAAALQRAGGEAAGAPPARLLEDLARARQRLGEFEAAVALLLRVRERALTGGDGAAVAAAERRLGLIRYWSGRHADALEHYARGARWARRSGDAGLYARIELARSDCLMELGRAADARRCIQVSLVLAERLGETPLLARVHLALLLLHTWTGPAETAWTYGERALALAQDLEDESLLCTTHWALTILAGLTGNSDAASRHLAGCTQRAEKLQSPLHRLKAAELEVEYRARTGDWDAGITVGERAIEDARSLGQHGPLARLLVWTGLIHMGRGDLERSRQYVEEAWRLAVEGNSSADVDIHTAVPAHCGIAAYSVAVGDFQTAVRIGMKGLRIAEGTGYTVWAIHRLLPTVLEAQISLGDIDGAAALGARLRQDSEAIGHELGIAWADACDGFLIWLRGDIAGGIERLRKAADRLEAIRVLPDAARLRRHLAARMRDAGRREEALAELRWVHDVFLQLGAEPELTKTRAQIRELGARPPLRQAAQGTAGLSPREVEIGRLAAAGESNKSIAKLLHISPRTVGTHLSNIFRKLDVDSRSALKVALRDIEMPADP